MAAVFFIITIPTAVEEQRLKTEFIARKLDIPAEQVDVHTGTSVASTNAQESNTTTTPTAERDTLSLETLKLANGENVGGKQGMLARRGSAQYSTFPKRRKSVPEALLIPFDKPDVDQTISLNEMEVMSNKETTTTDTTKGQSVEGLRVMINSAKRKMPKRNDADLDLPIDTAMEVVLREILKKFQIENAVWTTNTGGSIYQITFTVEFNEAYENVYDKLHEWGIGDREGSTVAVMNCIASKTYARKDDEDTPSELGGDNINTVQKQGVWDRFMNSVRARLNVAQIVRDVRQDAAITFDYVVLLISAAILASFGLVEDSTIFLASSMLISPLMGPIIAGIFGTVIKERSLWTIGMRNELIGILLATFVGFLFGLVVGTTDERYGIGEGLTEEMLARCDLHSLIVGVFTAIPSGAAAAIGILGGNIGSLVGVAISASLLPPAVNSGLLWALACIYKFFESDDSRYLYVVKSQLYSKNQAAELAILGTLSMCLTLSNVLCVYVMGILVLKVKEIAPVIGRNNSNFWKHDIKIARDYTRNGMVNTDAAIIDEFANLAKDDHYDFLRKLDEVTYQHTWSPLSNRHPFDGHGDERDNYSTIHKLEKLYTTISSPTAMQDKRRRFSISRRPSRPTDKTNRYRILLENRPRFASMPSNANVAANDVPEIVVDLCPSAETTSKRFTVTPADDPLMKHRSFNSSK